MCVELKIWKIGYRETKVSHEAKCIRITIPFGTHSIFLFADMKILFENIESGDRKIPDRIRANMRLKDPVSDKAQCRKA